MVDRNSYYYTAPGVRRRKRGQQPEQPPAQFLWRVDGRWEAFTSKRDIVAFIEERKAAAK